MGKNRRCYKYGGLGHMKRDYRETEKQTKPRWQKKETEGGIKKQEEKGKKEEKEVEKEKREEKKKKRNIGIVTIEEKDTVIARIAEEMREEEEVLTKREIELAKREDSVEKRENEIRENEVEIRR